MKLPLVVTELLTPAQAAVQLAVRPSTMASWRQRRAGPEFVKIGGRVLYHPAALQAWVTANTHAVSPQEATQ